MCAAYCYEYPRPALTVDAVVFRFTQDRWEVLLILRRHPPFAGSWALPGGFIDMDETLEQSAARELKEETGLENIILEQLHTYGDPGRDPRGRTVSVVYVGILKTEQRQSPRAGDDAAEAVWHNIGSLPPLAFDHDKILQRAMAWLESSPHSRSILIP